MQGISTIPAGNTAAVSPAYIRGGYLLPYRGHSMIGSADILFFYSSWRCWFLMVGEDGGTPITFFGGAFNAPLDRHILIRAEKMTLSITLRMTLTYLGNFLN